MRKLAFFLFTTVLGVQAAGSVYVPLDSWVYPALYRLAALGFVPDQTSNLAPWTRQECARQISEASAIYAKDVAKDKISSADTTARKIIADLKAEFLEKSDSNGLRLESMYTENRAIAGKPLTDSYHFGQTITNDYGRPYAQGFSNNTGISGYANFNRFFVYLRGESQQAPATPAYSLPVRQFLSSADSNPLLPAVSSSTLRFQPEEMYVGAQVGPESISFGRENLWWGPGGDSAFAFSDNAAPFYMLNFRQTQPLVLPGFLKHLGRIRTQFIFGELSGHAWPRKPLLNAQKVTFDLTDDFELGFTRSAFWGGVGHPLSFTSFRSSLVSTSSTGCGFQYADLCDPGDRHSGFDFRWRVAGLQKYLTIYSDSYADDDPSPLDNPKRSAWAPGIYLSHIPHASKIDLRFETYSTWMYRRDQGGQFVYFNNQYHDGYTNDGQLLGSWIGRDARAYIGSVGYWLSGRSRFEAQFKQVKQGPQFLPGGGTQTDGSLRMQWAFSPELLLAGSAQIERYDIPVLGPTQHDTALTVQFVYAPRNAVIR